MEGYRSNLRPLRSRIDKKYSAEIPILEEHEAKLTALRKALEDGEASGRADYTLEGLLAELDAEAVD